MYNSYMNNPEVSQPGAEAKASQSERPKTEEEIQEDVDRERHEADKAAITKGASPELATAYAGELGTQSKLDMVRAYAKGPEAVNQWRKEAAEDGVLAMELAAYGDGTGELTDGVREALEDRISVVQEQLDRLGENNFSDATVAEIRGATDRLEIERFKAEYRELEALRRGEAEQLVSPIDSTTEREKLEIPVAAETFNRDAQAAGVEGALDRDPGTYFDRKGAAIAIEVMKDLGMDETEMAAYANRLADQYNTLLASADTIHPDKSAQTKGMWAENQLWESMRNDPVWNRIDAKIDEQGENLAGRGGRISREKVMSGFVSFALRTSRS